MEPKIERKKYSAWLNQTADYVDKLLSDSSCLTNYMAMHKGNDLITNEKRSQLTTLRDDARKLAVEIEENRFKVVIAGPMSAGKSVLTNALALTKSLLPTASGECTMVSTEICYAEELGATVYFKERMDFMKDLRNEMKTLGYETSTIDEVCSYDSPQEFKSSTVFSEKQGFGVESRFNKLKMILDNINVLWSALDLDPLNIEYVTTENLGNYISNPERCMAIKKIVIRTPVLAGMRNAVLMDMPGYDSSDKIFSEMSKNMMRDADAIVIVQNLGDRSMAGSTSSDLLRNVTLGMPWDRLREFREKLFLFGNRIDTQPAQFWTDRAEQFCSQYANTIVKAEPDYLAYMKNHTIVGASIVYAPDEGMSAEDSTQKEKARRMIIDSYEEIERCPYSYYKHSSSNENNCVTALREKLQDYCNKVPHTQRIERAKQIIIDIESILEPHCVKTEAGDDFTAQFLSDDDSFFNPLMSALKAEKAELMKRISHDIPTKSSTAKLIDSCVQELCTRFPTFDEENWNIDETYRKIHNDWKSLYVENIHAVESQFRRARFFEFMELFSVKLEKTMPTIKWSLVDKLAPIFVQSLGVSESSKEGYDYLLKKTKEYLSNPEKIKLPEVKTNALIQKYKDNAEKIFRLLILTPFLSEDRWNYYHNNSGDFEKLGQYYDTTNTIPVNIDPVSYELQARMLFHKNRDEIADWWIQGLKEKVITLPSQFRAEAENILHYLSVKYLDNVESEISIKQEELNESEPLLKHLRNKKSEADKKPGRRCYTSLHYYRACQKHMGDIYRNGKESGKLSFTDQDIIREYNTDYNLMIEILKNIFPLSFNLDEVMCSEFESAVSTIENQKKDMIQWLRDEGLVETVEKCQDSVVIMRREAIREITETYKGIADFSFEEEKVS